MLDAPQSSSTALRATARRRKIHRFATTDTAMANPSTLTEDTEEDMSAEAVIARAIARRGEIFDEFRLLAQESPRTYDLISKTAGYMHHYTGAENADQNLSGPMRELIALCQLCAKGDDRFAANHVRRLWKHGITNKVMVEAATAIEIGRAHV